MDGYAVSYLMDWAMEGQKAYNRRLSFRIDYITTKATDIQIRAFYARLEPYGA